MPTIGLFRAAAAATQTSEALRALGYEVALAPVVRSVALAAEPPRRAFAVLVATSASAFDFAGGWLIERFRAAPLRLAGARTLQAARAKGLTGEAEAFGDAAALARALGQAPAGEALYLAGRDRKTLIETAFAASARAFTVVETYEARARERWSEAEIAGLLPAQAFLHYSRRSAELALQLAKAAALIETFAGAAHICLSHDVAAPLRREGFSRVVAAPAPDEPALLNALAAAVPPG